MGIISRMRKTARKITTPVKLTDLDTAETASFRLNGYCAKNLPALAALAASQVGEIKVKESNVQVSAAARMGGNQVKDGRTISHDILTAHLSDEDAAEYVRLETVKRDAARDARAAAEAQAAKDAEAARLAHIAALAEAALAEAAAKEAAAKEAAAKEAAAKEAAAKEAAKVPEVIQDRMEASLPSNGHGKTSKSSKG